MDEAEDLRKLRDHTIETRRIFSNAMKPERERMVCRAFLRCLGVSFVDSEIVASIKEPVDVTFRSADFQICELMELNRKRGDELKEFQEKAQNSTSIEDLATPYHPPSPLTFEELAVELTKALGKKAVKYGSGCRELDALVYVNLEGRHLYANSVIPDLSKLKGHGWRSVSALFPPYGVVLFANDSAPDFIQTTSGQAISKWDDWHTLFDKK